MRKLALLLVLVLGLLAAVPAYYLRFGPTPPLPPGPGVPVALADGTKLNVLQLGPGSHVVLVHGLPGSAYDWGTLPELLVSAGRHVVLYDRKGYGFSDRRSDQESYTFDANAKELLGLLAALDLRDVTLVGWAYGGGTAIRAAALDADRIGRLVLIGSAGPALHVSPPSLVKRVAMSAPVRFWITCVPPLYDRFMRRMAEQAFSGEGPPDWWMPHMRSILDLPGVWHAQIEENRALDPSVLRPEDVPRPVLVIHGSDDRLVPFRVAEDLHARSQPDAELVRVDGGSHMLPLTHPELVGRRIVEFSGPSQRSASPTP